MSTTALVTAQIPQRDLVEFHKLTERNQERVRKMLQAVEIIEAAPTLGSGYQRAAAEVQGGAGFTAGSLRNFYRRFREAGRDWRTAINYALEIRPSSSLPKEFLTHLQQRVDANGRSVAAALKKLHSDWTLGRPIPGYGTWRDWWKLQHPGLSVPSTCPGPPFAWSQRNLRRKLDTSRFRRKAQILGRAAAAAHRPMVYTTRKGLWVGSHYQFDDMWHDFFCNSMQERKPGRPLELFSHDIYSARKVRWGIRIRTEDDTGKAQGLNLQMMRMVLAATLSLDGYAERGTVLIAEHGTAAITEDVERLLYDASGGLITVSRSGFSGDPAHFGHYHGRRRGNFRHKASLESSNNLVHNLTADLPGQTGPNRERRPEQLTGLLKYNDRLLAAFDQLSPERAELLKFPLLSNEQLMQVLTEVYTFLENDTHHDLDDWEACGHTTTDVHLMGRWMRQADVLALEDDQKDLALALIQAGSVKTRARKLSRREVWDAGAAGLLQVPGSVTCSLLGKGLAAERKVRDHMLQFHDAEVGPGLHRFEALVTDDYGEQHVLKDRETYLCTVNPFASDRLFVRDAKGRYLGQALRLSGITRGDLDGLRDALGRATKTESALLEPLRKRQAEEARKRKDLHDHNAGVIGRRAPKISRRLASQADDFLDDDDEDDQDTPPATGAPALAESSDTHTPLNPDDFLD